MKKNIGFIVLGILSVVAVVTISLIVYEYQRIHYITLRFSMQGCTEEYLLIGEETEIQYACIVNWCDEGGYYSKNKTEQETIALTIEEFKKQYTLSTNNDNITIKDDKIIANKEGETKLIFTQNKEYFKKDYEGKKYCYRFEATAVMVYDPESPDFIKINNAEDFMNISSLGTTKKYILNQDIDFKNIEYTPIKFEGIFINPKGYVIRNINYNSREEICDSLITSPVDFYEQSESIVLGLKLEGIRVDINANDVAFALFDQKVYYMRDLNIKDFDIHLNIDSEQPESLLFLTNLYSFVLKDIKAEYNVSGTENTKLTLSYVGAWAMYCNNLDINVKTDMSCVRRYNDYLGVVEDYSNNNSVKVNGNAIDREHW